MQDVNVIFLIPQMFLCGGYLLPIGRILVSVVISLKSKMLLEMVFGIKNLREI